MIVNFVSALPLDLGQKLLRVASLATSEETQVDDARRRDELLEAAVSDPRLVDVAVTEFSHRLQHGRVQVSVF